MKWVLVERLIPYVFVLQIFTRGPERVPHFLRHEVNNKITSFWFSKKKLNNKFSFPSQSHNNFFFWDQQKEHKFLFFVSAFCWHDPVVMLMMQTKNFFGINKTKEVKCLQALNKKKLSNVYFLFRFLWKSLPTTTAAQHLLFLSKRSQKKVGLRTNGKLFFFFLFPHLPKTNGL